MIKITYNRNNAFSHRFISHLEESQVNQLLAKTNISLDTKRKDDSRKVTKKFLSETPSSEFKHSSELKIQNDFYEQAKTDNVEESNQRQWLKKARPVQVKSSKQFKETKDPIQVGLQQFLPEEANNINVLKQAYLRVCFEKMAIQASYQNLVNDSIKKDEMIHQLRVELDQKQNIAMNQQQVQNSHFGFNIPATTTNQSKNIINFPGSSTHLPGPVNSWMPMRNTQPIRNSGY